MIKYSQDNDFIIFNPDTLWHKIYIDEINKMQDFYAVMLFVMILLPLKERIPKSPNEPSFLPL